METAPSDVATAIIRHLGRSRDVYREMAALADAQVMAIEGKDDNAITVIVEEKGRRLAALDDVERSLAPLRTRWAALADGADPGLRARIEAAVDEVRGSLSHLLTLEEAARVKMEAARRMAGERVRYATAGRRAMAAYGGAASGATLLDGAL